MRSYAARMSYSVKEIFYTLQGEGARRPAARRCSCASPAAICGAAASTTGRRHLPLLRHRFRRHRRAGRRALRRRAQRSGRRRRGRSGRGGRRPRYVVCTGGEPLLQLDEALIAALHGEGFEIAVETNGTLEPPPGDRLDLRQPQGRTRRWC